MTDFVGNNLGVGDNVVYCSGSGGSKSMYVAKVIGFTERMVKVAYYPNTFNKSFKVESLVAPHNCVVYKIPSV